MKVRNINFSFLVLALLVIGSFAFYAGAENNPQGSNIFQDSDQDGLSDAEEKLYGTDPHKSDTDGDGYSDGAEVKSGYDPLKPAPGDRIVPDADKTAAVQASSDDGSNLTKIVAAKISQLSQDSDSSDGQDVTMDSLRAIVSDSLGSDSSFSADSLPKVDESDIRIKKQNYSGLSDDRQAEKKKADFINYITGVIYVISSNSPKPITSLSDINTASDYVTNEIISALVNRDASGLDDLNASGEKMYNQLKQIEVPEEVSETHIKALRFALYAKSLEAAVPKNESDPLGDIANFAKIEAFLTVASQFGDSVQADFKKYDIDYEDDDFLDKLKDMGIDVSKEDIDKATATLDTVSSAAGTLNLGIQ